MNHLQEILKRYKGKTSHLVETGTHYCAGIHAALKAGFDQVTSFEIDASKVMAARVICPRLVVDIVHASSAGPEFAAMAKGARKTFFLDAHKMGPRGRIPQDYPLTAELAAILAGRALHTVIIDDVRLFGRYGTTVERIVADFAAKSPRYRSQLVTHRDNIPDDMLVLTAEVGA